MYNQDTDIITRDYLQRLNHNELRLFTVAQAGHIPPYQKGIDVCDTELIAFIDDDAVPEENWIENIYKTFAP